MSEAIDNDDLPVPDELTTLKARADRMGVSYHPSIGLEKLREKVKSALSPDTKPTVIKAAQSAEETAVERRTRKRREASELVRIRVACMNPAKKEWEGEIFTVGNSLVGSFTKYVPFNTEDGWHVPRIIFNQISQRQCQVFTTVTDAKGNKSRKGKLIKEFSVEVMPNLTPKELAELARRQAMAKSID